jgi:hypothetical protein
MSLAVRISRLLALAIYALEKGLENETKNGTVVAYPDPVRSVRGVPYGWHN